MPLPETWRRRARQVMPARVHEWVASGRLHRVRQRNAARPASEVFSGIYAEGMWGQGGPFDSGSGSRGAPAEAYAALIRKLIHETGSRSVADIGCGDFTVASAFAGDLESYHGLDVADEIVERNTRLFATDGIRFSTVDAAAGPLPPADLCLIRQVFQHLSNNQIGRILSHCRVYPVVVITEHWPAGSAMRKPNADKPHGPDTRLDRGSWVDISAPPFLCAATEELLRVEPERPLFRAGETIRTHLWRP